MVKLTQDGPRLADGRFDGKTWLTRVCSSDVPRDRALLERALNFVRARSGDDESILQSGVEFAELMVEVRMDTASIASALVYRCVRAGLATLADVEREVDADVAHLVADVERVGTVSVLELSNAPLLARAARDQVENVRRMLVAMIDDVRVAIVKLAERIMALQMVKNAPAARQQRIANEVLEVFAPLANRLGIWRLKWQLEDLAFRYLNPPDYRRIASRLDGKRVEREANVSSVGSVLASALAAEGIAAEIHGRAKHIYSIWRKMRAKHIDFDQVYDVQALRVVVSSTRDCYAALGVIHTHWRHIPREFDDYIANPKDNGYRSIHTAVVGPDQRTVEIQIRTREMHRDAELGVCAHWAYKHDSGRDDALYTEKLSWLRQVLEWHEEVGGFVSVGREIRSNIEQGRIYVLTPGGHVLDLPEGSTPIDFAFRVHTEVGLHCIGARVDGAFVALNTPLATGQRVEIDTERDALPQRDWLNQDLGYVRTARARVKLQAWFRSLDREQNVQAGHAMLGREFERLAIVTDPTQLAARLGYPDAAALWFAIAIGERQLPDVVAAATDSELADLAAVSLIDITGADRAGILHDITAVLAEQDLSLVSIQARADDNSNTATIQLGVEVRDVAVLAKLLDRISRVPGVVAVQRRTQN
jgi:GTP pyrophosphokinase